MATVKITETLIDGVECNIRKLFESRITSLRNLLDGSPTLDVIFAEWYAPYKTVISQVPVEFLSLNDKLCFVYNGMTFGEQKFSDKVALPVNSIDTNRFEFRPSSWSPTLRVLDVPENDKLLVEVKQSVSQRKDMLAERDAMCNNVRKLLKSHATLAPALKKWAPLWDLLDEKYQDRHKQVVTRAKQSTEAEDLSEIDFDAMTGTVVASKLMK